MTFRRSFALIVVGTLAGVACTRASATAPEPSPSVQVASLTLTGLRGGSGAEARSRPAERHVRRPFKHGMADDLAWAVRGRGVSDAFPTHDPVGQDLELLVAKTARDKSGGAWLRIMLPIRPNGAAGWVRMGR